MSRCFCLGKKDFCDGIEDCLSCEFANWEGSVKEDEISLILSKIFGEDYNLDRLKELVEADRDGRCVVLPCKIGDTIYDIQMGKITEKTIISIPFLLSKSVNHLCLHAINIRNAITTIDTENLGKTVFLTREEAESALKKMKERDNR